MKQFLVIVAAVAVLAGCASEAEIKAAHGRACAQEGHSEGTAPHKRCVEMKHSEWRAAMRNEHHRAQQRMMHNMRR